MQTQENTTKLALFLFINTGMGWEGGPRAQVGVNSGLDYFNLSPRDELSGQNLLKAKIH